MLDPHFRGLNARWSTTDAAIDCALKACQNSKKCKAFELNEVTGLFTFYSKLPTSIQAIGRMQLMKCFDVVQAESEPAKSTHKRKRAPGILCWGGDERTI